MAKLLNVKECVGLATVELGIALRAPSTVVTSMDQDVVQMGALLYAVADEVLLDEPYKTILGDGLWLRDVNGEQKPSITADSDIIAFDGRLAVDGLKFRFLKAKGLEFGEEMRDFSTRLNRLAGRINGRVLDLDSDEDRTI